MFRKLTIAAVTAAALVTGVAATAEAAPREYERHEHFHGCRYEVLVNHRGCWDVYGTYRDRREADRVAHELGCHGRAVQVREV
jgi:hypothetical protein